MTAGNRRRTSIGAVRSPLARGNPTIGAVPSGAVRTVSDVPIVPSQAWPVWGDHARSRPPTSWAATAPAALASVAGLSVADLYRDAPLWVQQARGIDLATLLLATPILVAGLWASGYAPTRTS